MILRYHRGTHPSPWSLPRRPRTRPRQRPWSRPPHPQRVPPRVPRLAPACIRPPSAVIPDVVRPLPVSSWLLRSSPTSQLPSPCYVWVTRVINVNTNDEEALRSRYMSYRHIIPVVRSTLNRARPPARACVPSGVYIPEYRAGRKQRNDQRNLRR